jgi:hypothetical protein
MDQSDQQEADQRQDSGDSDKKREKITKLIEETGEKLITKYRDPQHNWIQNREVLVGMRARCTLPVEGHVP